MGLIVLFLLALIVPLAYSGPVSAHDHLPPKAYLKGEPEKQVGNRYREEWISGNGTSCSGMAGDGPRVFPGAVSVDGNKPGRINLRKTQRPDRARLVGWRAIDPNGSPIGPGEEVPTTLLKRRVDGKRLWQVRFDVPAVGDFYIDLLAVWSDRQKCGGRQKVWWAFHSFSDPPE